jgi:hypothetical protein
MVIWEIIPCVRIVGCRDDSLNSWGSEVGMVRRGKIQGSWKYLKNIVLSDHTMFVRMVSDTDTEYRNQVQRKN